jgi:hypothetical protein
VSEFAWTAARARCPPFPASVVTCLENAHRGYFWGAHDEYLPLTLVLFTEYKRNGQLFRAHPAYRGGRPWHDWAMFQYEKSAQDAARRKSYMETTHDDEVFHGDPPTIAHNHHYAPGKILCFVQAPGKTLQAVVLCCAFKHVRSAFSPPIGRSSTRMLERQNHRFVDGCGGNCSTLLDDPREQRGAWLPRSVGEGAMGKRICINIIL